MSQGPVAAAGRCWRAGIDAGAGQEADPAERDGDYAVPPIVSSGNSQGERSWSTEAVQAKLVKRSCSKEAGQTLKAQSRVWRIVKSIYQGQGTEDWGPEAGGAGGSIRAGARPPLAGQCQSNHPSPGH